MADCSNPTLMLGYGAYGQPLEADFRAHHLPLLNRGWVIALAHVRYICSRGIPFVWLVPGADGRGM